MARQIKEFWETAEDWSRRKHLILGYYLIPAAAKLGTTNPDRRVFVLDAFAGRGKYANNDPGSPVLLGQLADKCASWTRPVNLRIYNIEPNNDNYNELNHCTKNWVDAGRVVNVHGRFQDNLDHVLQQVGHSPLIAFLDPFRPSHLLFEDFAPLLQRADKTEVLIVFHTPAVIRTLQAAHPLSQNTEGTKEALAKTLDQLFGHSRWRNLWEREEITPTSVVDCFNSGIMGQVAGNAWVCSTAINARYKSRLKYHIIFLTRHPDGLKLMNDAFVKEKRTAFSGDPANSQLQLLRDLVDDPTAMTDEERVECLSQTLEEIGRALPNKTWVRSALCFELLSHRFGEFLEKEHRQAVDSMIHRPSPPRIQPLDAHQFSTGRWRTNDETRLRFVL